MVAATAPSEGRSLGLSLDGKPGEPLTELQGFPGALRKPSLTESKDIVVLKAGNASYFLSVLDLSSFFTGQLTKLCLA